MVTPLPMIASVAVSQFGLLSQEPYLAIVLCAFTPIPKHFKPSVFSLQSHDIIAIHMLRYKTTFNLNVDNDLHHSDHFPLIISDIRQQSSSIHRSSNYNINSAIWSKFTSLAILAEEMVPDLEKKPEEDRKSMNGIEELHEEENLRETEFGWSASGRLEEAKTNDVLVSCFLLNDNSIEDTLKQFFDLESLGIRDDPCIHEDQALKIFNDKVQYNNGRYIVELPFHKHIKELSDNLIVAKQRFQILWRRLQKDTDLHSKYEEIIQDYLNLGIIEKVDTCELCKDKPFYYLPHQVVKKEGRVTPSTHIVFDATPHQANELSLNDCLCPGPNLYPNLLDVLIKFRLNKIAISSDIRQSFLQICLADKHKDALLFLWTPSDSRIEKRPVLEICRFNRGIFGVNANTYMYVDDWITDQDTQEEVLLIFHLAKNIMKEAGMKMRKWISNDSTLMNQWVAEGFDTYPADTSVFSGSNKTKVLGMAWQTQDNCFTLDITGLLEIISASEITKRSLLQAIGKIFDPLGLLTPFTIRVKCLIQEL
ncbi:hypothetical protein HNY73_007194 [Argiope bruennichi]|uniref:Peptidase aspartic putative domain-containing protein n=1 Tax=Argiope bruennichi TaxID=94029 RepID=A0A8T0FD80_ARGBR|nr:hypothetical protein HNY73_007194 [Argiope bruennichi]